jgi:hypothetical protein
MIKASLVANSASLGLNWIYNMPYLKRITKDKNPEFWPIDPEVYEKARKGYLAYPNHQVGDLSFQGNLLLLLYKKLIEFPDYTPKDWRRDIYEYIKPGGLYEGWVETYGLDLVVKVLAEQMYKKDSVIETSYDDDQLVGFIPYLAFKALHLDLSYSLEFVKVLSVNQDFKRLYDMFDVIYEGSLSLESMQKAIKDAIHLAPEKYHRDLDKAVSMEDTDKFIVEYSGTACHINHSVPLIIHLLFHGKSYEDVVRKNTIIGGASSDRGLMLGFLMSKVSKVPDEWIKILLKRTVL